VRAIGQRVARLAGEQERVAHSDPLTSLANRKALMGEIAVQVAGIESRTGVQVVAAVPV